MTDQMGYVKQRKDGRWGVCVMVDGRRKQTTCATQEQAETKRREFLGLRRDGEMLVSPHQRLDRFIDHWIEDVVRLKVRPHTYWGYKSEMKHVTGRLGHLRLDALKAAHISRLYSHLHDAKLAALTIHHIHVIFKGALRYAVSTGLLERNPADGVALPRPEKTDIRALSLDEVALLLEASEDMFSRALWAFLVETGLRIGEASALRWPDVQGSVVRVRHTTTHVRGRGAILGPPKTPASRRDIPYSLSLGELLDAHHQEQRELRARTLGWQHNDLIFPGRHGQLLHNSSAWLRLQRDLDAAGLPPMGVHALRHTAATLWIHHFNIPIRVAQERLGHEDVSTTLGMYTHVNEGMHRDAAVLIGQRLFRGA